MWFYAEQTKMKINETGNIPSDKKYTPLPLPPPQPSLDLDKKNTPPHQYTLGQYTPTKLFEQN